MAADGEVFADLLGGRSVSDPVDLCTDLLQDHPSVVVIKMQSQT
jgi:hypothetical protein